jgi:hypothetical protein
LVVELLELSMKFFSLATLVMNSFQPLTTRLEMKFEIVYYWISFSVYVFLACVFFFILNYWGLLISLCGEKMVAVDL